MRLQRIVIYRLLDRPLACRFAQKVLAPGAATARRRLVGRQWDDSAPSTPALDVGCGPRSWLAGLAPTTFGVDLSLPYLRVFREAGGHGTLASADSLPFARGSFGSVWSFGLLHHLPDSVATAAIVEMVRVCRGGGRVVVFDGVYPERWWSRPLAYLIRRLDRGEFMRSQRALQALFPNREAWGFERRTSAYTGLELIVATRRVEERSDA